MKYIVICLFVVTSVIAAYSQSSAQEIKPFDMSQEQLPANYHGFDVVVIERALKDKKKRLQKDEFETTEDYNKRKKIEESRPFIGSVKLDSKIAFELFIDNLTYNADRQIMEVQPYNSILGLQLASPYSYISIKNFEKWEIKMDIQTAKQAKPFIRALAVVTPAEPFFYDHSHTVFTVQLHEIWFYHESTGKIFYKQTPYKIPRR